MIIIGEKINATIPRIKGLLMEHDGESLKMLAKRQEEAGAGVIDVNVATGEGSARKETEDMQWLVGLLNEAVDAKLSIDSADIKVLEAGLRAAGDRAGFVNSVKATDESISEVFPLVAEFGVPVIALAMDEKGIPKDVPTRLRACEKIAKGAEQHGVQGKNIFFDPLVMPVSTDVSQGVTTLETLREIKKQFNGAGTVLALSNVSFGLPGRSTINRAMLHMAMFLAVDALLLDPLDAGLMDGVRAAEVVMGRDRHCRRYTRAIRQREAQ
jgi:cobalamin-dependent methionine synthase I